MGFERWTRREFLARSGKTLAAGALGAFAAPALASARLAEDKPARILMFTKSSGFEHSVIRRRGGQLSHAERVFTELGKKHNFEVLATKDGRIFDGDLDRFDAFFFYTSGDLTKPGTDKQPPMSPRGKEALLEAVRSGKGFLASHCASDSFHSPGPRNRNQKVKDPYIAMLGGEFIRHGAQQKARMRVADPKFPGIERAGDGFELFEEWYALKNFAPDLHVILVTETKGMRGKDYERPPYPGTWARLEKEGRVFYTSMGHREDVWTHPIFQDLLAGAVAWAVRRADADVTPNIDRVTPQAHVLPYD